MTEPADREEDIAASPSAPDAMDHDEIYGEDGSIRQDYLTAIGAAIADRDVLFLREHVVRLHESELGDLLESISAPQRHAQCIRQRGGSHLGPHAQDEPGPPGRHHPGDP